MTLLAPLNASLAVMSREASATLLHLWLLARQGVQKSTEVIADTLYVDVRTVEDARAALKAEGLLRLERPSILAPYRYFALKKRLYPGWQAKRTGLPSDLADASPAAKAIYFYVAGRPGLTRTELSTALSLSYRGVQEAITSVEPWFSTEGEKPVRYSLRKEGK